MLLTAIPEVGLMLHSGVLCVLLWCVSFNCNTRRTLTNTSLILYVCKFALISNKKANIYKHNQLKQYLVPLSIYLIMITFTPQCKCPYSSVQQCLNVVITHITLLALFCLANTHITSLLELIQTTNVIWPIGVEVATANTYSRSYINAYVQGTELNSNKCWVTLFSSARYLTQ